MSANEYTADGRDDLRTVITSGTRCCGHLVKVTCIPREKTGALKVHLAASTDSSELRACDESNENVLRVTVASDLSKAATDNHFEGKIEETEAEAYFNYFETGIRKASPGRESPAECEDPTVEFAKKHPRSPFGNEARPKSVHPAKRAGPDRDENGEAIMAYRIHDFESCGGNLFDGRKAKGITYRALVEGSPKVIANTHDRSPNALNLLDESIGSPKDNPNFDLPKAPMGRSTESGPKDAKLGDAP